MAVYAALRGGTGVTASHPGQCSLLRPRRILQLITSAYELLLLQILVLHYFLDSFTVRKLLHYTFNYSKPLKLHFIGSLPQGRSGGNA